MRGLGFIKRALFSFPTLVSDQVSEVCLRLACLHRFVWVLAKFHAKRWKGRMGPKIKMSHEAEDYGLFYVVRLLWSRVLGQILLIVFKVL